MTDAAVPPGARPGRPARARARRARLLARAARSSPRPSSSPRAAPSGSSTRARRPPTACPAPTTSRPASSRTSSPASAPCAATTWPARPAGTATACPVELAVEKELGFNGKKDIEAYGIAEFNAKCRESVTRHTDAFAELTTRMGYWVDLDDAYRTMDPEYVESVWWSLKEIFDKGLLVQDHRVAPWCPRCGTGLSDHELAQGYETVVDPSVYVRFPLTSGPLAGEAALLVWTTTPWTLVSNTAVAAHPDVDLRRRHERRREARRRRAAAGQGPRRGLGGHRPALHRAPRWSAGRYQRPFDLVEFAGRALSSSTPSTSPPRTAPVWSTSPPPSVRTTSRSAARTACRWSTRSAPTAPSRRTSPWSAASSSRRPTRRSPRTSTHAACSSGTSRTSTATRTAGAATPRCSTTRSRPGTSAPPPIKDALLQENEKHQLVPGLGQARPLRRLAEQQHRLGAVPQPLLGHPAADLALRGRPPHLRRLPAPS